MSELVRAVAVSKTFDAGGAMAVHALRAVSLAVARGEIVVVTGPSGSGKTTLLSVLGGLLRPDRGEVHFDGVDLGRAEEPVRRRLRAERIGFVFQRGLLIDYLSVRDNVALVLRARGMPTREANTHAAALLERVDLRQRADALPRALSAGETQRVAVARALVTQPALVLADEPTAHLDRATGTAVVGLLRERVRAAGAALVLVTHDPRLADPADRRLHLEDGALG